MNADEFAEIKARHPRERHDCPSCDEYVCSRGEWDICDAACLVSEVERLRGVVEAAATMMRERDAFMASYRSDSPGYDTSLGALRAALAALEAKE